MTNNANSTGRNWRELVAGLGLELNATRTPSRAANEGFVPVDGDDFYRICRDGDRTDRLVRTAGSLLGNGLTLQNATEILLALNRYKNEPPLEEEKVRKTVASIARTHGRNHPTDDSADTPLFDLKTVSVRRFLAAEAPAREWVLEDCIPLGKAGLLIAPGGTGKSQFVLQMAYDVATGRQKYSPWPPSKPGKVIILSAEDEEDELHRRFRRLASEDMSSEGRAVLDLLEENLYIVPRVGEDNLLTQGEYGQVIQTRLAERILASIGDVAGLALIVIDTLSRFRGGDENSAVDTTRCVEALELLAKRSRAAVLAVHHTNKASSSNSEPSQNASRGSSALVDGVRLVLNMSFVTGKHAGQNRSDQLLDIRITKTNYGPLGDAVLLRRDDQGRLVQISGEEAGARRWTETISKVVNLLNAEAGEGRLYSKSTFAHAFAGLDGSLGMGQTALKAFIDRACDTGVLEVEHGKSKHLRVRTSAS